jgi:hypothetical protein
MTLGADGEKNEGRSVVEGWVEPLSTVTCAPVDPVSSRALSNWRSAGGAAITCAFGCGISTGLSVKAPGPTAGVGGISLITGAVTWEEAAVVCAFGWGILIGSSMKAPGLTAGVGGILLSTGAIWPPVSGFWTAMEGLGDADLALAANGDGPSGSGSNARASRAGDSAMGLGMLESGTGGGAGGAVSSCLSELRELASESETAGVAGREKESTVDDRLMTLPMRLRIDGLLIVGRGSWTRVMGLLCCEQVRLWTRFRED